MDLVCPVKFCISIVFNFSWDPFGRLQYPGEMKHRGYAKFWGANNVCYGRCANDECLCTILGNKD